MSLFNSREYWSTRLGADEEFDQGGICIANVDNDPNGAGKEQLQHAVAACTASLCGTDQVCCTAVKIVSGSLQGMLRVHMPHEEGYRIEDILLETELEGSILQLAAGNFLGCVPLTTRPRLMLYGVTAVTYCSRCAHRGLLQ